MLDLYRNIKKFRTQNEMSQAELARLSLMRSVLIQES